MSKVIILCGKIASGKTYYAKELKKKSNAIILSVDDLMLKLSDSCMGNHHDDIARRCERYFYSLAEQILLQGLDVIIDFGYWTRKEREEAKVYFKSREIQVELHYIKVADEKRFIQLANRNQCLIMNRNKQVDRVYIIHEELRKRLDSKFEEPTPNEIDVLIS
jgi:predicted kinase